MIRIVLNDDTITTEPQSTIIQCTRVRLPLTSEPARVDMPARTIVAQTITDATHLISISEVQPGILQGDALGGPIFMKPMDNTTGASTNITGIIYQYNTPIFNLDWIDIYLPSLWIVNWQVPLPGMYFFFNL
jgi:hypothetical protein